MADFTFNVVSDRTDEILAKIEQNATAALEAAGITAVSNAQQNVTARTPRNPGLTWYRNNGASGLRGSISHQLKDDGKVKTVEIGTNNEHAIYNEYGTGSYAEKGNGRQGWWVFVPGGGVHGSNNHKIYTEAQARNIVRLLKEQGLDAHMTNGIKPIHFLKDAISEHLDQLKAIIEQYLKR